MKKLILGLSLLLAAILLLAGWQYLGFYDNKLHVVFCNVGQGDGILIKTPNNRTMLIDAGPDKSILTCLSDHLPFWMHNIDFLVLTHPHSDHFGGMTYVLDQYSVTYFFSENLRNKATDYVEFQQQLKANHIEETDVLGGSGISFKNGLTISFIGPSKSYLAESSPNGTIGETKEQACIVSLVKYGSFRALLTCDSEVAGLRDAFKEWIPEPVDVLQVPHHGSRYGLDTDIIDKLAPRVSVISVGKNVFGHPNPQIIQMLKQRGSKVMRTDNNGTVEIISNGKTFRVTSER